MTGFTLKRTANCPMCLAPRDWKSKDAEIARLTAELAAVRERCAGRIDGLASELDYKVRTARNYQESSNFVYAREILQVGAAAIRAESTNG